MTNYTKIINIVDTESIPDSNALSLAMELISRQSITPNDAGCQEIIAYRLGKVGFKSETLSCGQVRNLWTCHGEGEPLLVFAGHTDVVPAGDLASWTSSPFVPEVRNGMLYGRGASDMKSSIASFVCAAEDFVVQHPGHIGTIALLLTSDEEGDALDGTRYVVDVLKSRKQKIDMCIVGEPTSSVSLGDTIKIGRRGSLTGYLTFNGKQGHVAYPEKVDNPIHRAVLALTTLLNTDWDSIEDTGSDSVGAENYFPPTSFQITKFCSDAGASNVVPQKASIVFNFRFSPKVTINGLKTKVEEVLGTSYDILWQIGAMPFITKPGKLVSSISESISKIIKIRPVYSTSGGTSDGRFIAPISTELAELGLVNETIHQTDECVRAIDIELLKQVYLSILERLMI